MQTTYSAQPLTAESSREHGNGAPSALTALAPGVSVALLRRVWFATPADRRHQRSSLLESVVKVKRNGRVEASPLRDLTLVEVEAAIGAVTPRWVVRFYTPGKLGVQLQTFVGERDAEAFAASQRLYAKPAVVLPIG